jgi:hypothetical protein
VGELGVAIEQQLILRFQAYLACRSRYWWIGREAIVRKASRATSCACQSSSRTSFRPCVRWVGPAAILRKTKTLTVADMAVEGIFRKNGNIRRLQLVAESLDRDPAGVNLWEENPVQLAALLKRWLREMPDPLLTFRLHKLFCAAACEWIFLTSEHRGPRARRTSRNPVLRRARLTLRSSAQCGRPAAGAASSRHAAPEGQPRLDGSPVRIPPLGGDVLVPRRRDRQSNGPAQPRYGRLPLDPICQGRQCRAGRIVHRHRGGPGPARESRRVLHCPVRTHVCPEREHLHPFRERAGSASQGDPSTLLEIRPGAEPEPGESSIENRNRNRDRTVGIEQPDADAFAAAGQK